MRWYPFVRIYIIKHRIGFQLVLNPQNPVENYFSAWFRGRVVRFGK